MAANKLKRPKCQNSCRKEKWDASSVIFELKEKLSRLRFRLFDCQNQNQMLRKELRLAKKVVSTEVSPVSKDSFTDLLQETTCTDYHGRREKILLLKDKLNELQNRIKEMEEGSIDEPTEGTRAEQKAQGTQKEIKRMCHQKFQTKQMVDKELQYLLENSCQMKRKLEVWKKRNAEVSKEAELLRLELGRLLEKSQEDKNVHESYHVVDKELRARQNERLDLRSKLEIEKSRNEQLVAEIARVKDDISLILSKINDDKVLIEALNNQKGYLHDLLERQKMISESDNRRFRDDLREMKTKHTTDRDVLVQLKDVIEEKNHLCKQVQDTMKQKTLIDTEDGKDEKKTSPADEQPQEGESQQQSGTPADPLPESNIRDQSEEENEITKLTEERDECLNILKSMSDELGQLLSVLSANDERLKDWMSQLLQSRSLLALKNAEVHDLQETSKKLQKSSYSRKGNGFFSFTDEIKEAYEVLNEEHEFLQSLWELLMTDKENSTFVYTVSVDAGLKLFADAISDMMLPEDKSTSEEQQQPVEHDESVDYESNAPSE